MPLSWCYVCRNILVIFQDINSTVKYLSNSMKSCDDPDQIRSAHCSKEQETDRAKSHSLCIDVTFSRSPLYLNTDLANPDSQLCPQPELKSGQCVRKWGGNVKTWEGLPRLTSARRFHLHRLGGGSVLGMYSKSQSLCVSKVHVLSVILKFFMRHQWLVHIRALRSPSRLILLVQH